MASVQIPQHFRENKMVDKKIWAFYGFGCSENTYLHILYYLGYILHSPKPLLFVGTFSSQPQSTNFEQNLTRSLHFIGFTSEVGGASSLTLVWAIADTRWRKRTQI